jgi:hypothetical protein
MEHNELILSILLRPCRRLASPCILPDATHDKFQNRGVQIVQAIAARAIADAQYGLRDFEVGDFEGYIRVETLGS